MRVPAIATLTIVVASIGIAASSHAHDESRALSTAVFAGGCFWGVESVFEHVRGVEDVVSGFAGTDLGPGDYLRPFRGSTGLAESVKVTYDSTKVSYEELLRVFFSIAHDPTQVDRQGPDVGKRYRSVVFVSGAGQERAALAWIDSLGRSGHVRAPIATQVARLGRFIVAPPEHQDYAERNPRAPYVVINDAPKIEHLRHELPALFRDR